MKAMRTVRVHVAAGEEVAEARRAVWDVMEMLNRHFRPRGVEFAGAGEGAGDWTIAIYWKDFGEMGREEFEAVYAKFRKEKKPIIHVFFKEPDEGIGEALKAFKEAFAERERYGHFYCHFETADAVKFQLAAQSLSLLPGGGGSDLLTVDGGVVRMGAEPVAKMEDLPFARLNAKRKSLVRQIAAAEAEVLGLEADAKATPEDADLQEVLRAARERRHDLKEEMKLHDGFLFNVAVSFAKATAEETSERTRKAWALFQQGKAQEANKLLDWDVLDESAERTRRLFRAGRDAYEKNLQEYLAKAKIVMADDSMAVTERVDAASRAYGEAIAIARDIHWEDEKLAEVLFDYAYLLDRQHRFQPSIRLYIEALEIFRRLAATSPAVYEQCVANTLNNLALLHAATQRLVEAEAEYTEALEIYRRRLAATSLAVYEQGVAMTLNNLANLHGAVQHMAITVNNLAILDGATQRVAEAEAECAGALEIWRRLSAVNRELYEPYVAMTLNDLANIHDKTRRFAEAEAELKEALTMQREFVAVRSEAHEPALAMMLDSLATLHKDTQRFAEAEAEYVEALSLFRKVEATRKDSQRVEVAGTLCNLSELYEACGKTEDALKAAREALETCERSSDCSHIKEQLERARALVKRLEASH